MLGTCAAVLAAWLSTAGLHATGSDVADAVMRGDREAARELLVGGADVNAPQADGATALHWAVYRGDASVVNMLIGAGADVDAANRNGATPLSLASVKGDPIALVALIDAGADPNEQDLFGRTPLMRAARTGIVEALAVLLDRGAEVNAQEALRGTTALMWAADEGYSEALDFLIRRGADIAARSNPAPRGRGPALGKSNDPRRAVAALRAAQEAGREPPDLRTLLALGRAEDGADAETVANDDAGKRDPPAPPPARRRRRPPPADGGALTALTYAVRANSLEATGALLAAGAAVNEVTGYGWSPLLVATQNRYYRLGAFLLDQGADPDLPNDGGWTPLYLATDNRNIEHGDYPVRRPDMDHLEFIELLLDRGADVNARAKDSTETRTVFTNQWLDENGATALLRASQSSDLELMRLLLGRGADPTLNTVLNVTPLQVAAGIGWVEGVTFEWSEDANIEAVNLLLDLRIDPNIQADTGRTALHGAAHKGRAEVVQILVDHGADLSVEDYGNTDNRGGRLATHTWRPVDYADGLVRVGVQSAIAHEETGLLIRQLMQERGLDAPPMGRTLESICITDACR